MNSFIKTLSLVIALGTSSYLLHGQSVLNIETKDISGNTSSISEITNSDLIVLDFWATWCKPCVKSIPKLIELSEKYNSKEISFVGINEDSPRNTNKVKPFVKSLGINYPVLLDPNQEIMNELMVNSYPTLIIINSDAKVLFMHEGYTSGDEILIEQEINKLLGKNE